MSYDKLRLGKLQNSVKVAIGLLGCCLFRLIPMPAPNVEPIMAFTMPYAKKFGRAVGFIFAFLALASFDFISGRFGLWTIYCGLAYGAVGVLASVYLTPLKKATRKHFVAFAVVGTLFYDAVSALVFGWQFGQPLWVTLVGQIPFTLYHLAGNIAFAAVLSPLIAKHLLEAEEKVVVPDAAEDEAGARNAVPAPHFRLR